MRTRDRIKAFVLDHVAVDEVGETEDIFENGLVSSMFVMELVLFVEQEFGVEVDGDDLDFDHFRTVEALDALVNRKLTAA